MKRVLVVDDNAMVRQVLCDGSAGAEGVPL